MTKQPPMKRFLLLASFAGLLFCLLQASGAELLCATQGCRIYSGYGLFGISFYTLGSAGFLLLILLTLLYPRAGSTFLLPFALLTVLVLDALFLAYQALFWPCSSCLATAFLFALAVLAGLKTFNRAGRRLLLVTGGLWLVLFLFLTLSSLKEIVFRPWPIFGPADAPIRVFFSPDCPACRQTVRQLLENRETVGKAAFYPIAKNEEDFRQIARYLALTELPEGDPDTFLRLFSAAAGDAPASLPWRIRLHLVANKVSLARLGAETVPLVIAPYLPAPAPAPLDLFAPPAADPLFDGCPAFGDKACD